MPKSDPLTEGLGKLAALSKSGDYDFIDLGSSKGGSLDYARQRLGLSNGIGIDISASKVEEATARGHLVVQADATALDVTAPLVEAVIAMHFLEHLPDGATARAVLQGACRLASALVYVRQPYFDADVELSRQGLLPYWSNWSGHPNHMLQSDVEAALDPLLFDGTIQRYVIFGARRINDASDPALLPTNSPRNQGFYDSALHGSKPSGPLHVEAFYELGVIVIKDAMPKCCHLALQLSENEYVLADRSSADIGGAPVMTEVESPRRHRGVTSYAQNGEDLQIAYFLGKREEVTYIDVGCLWPVEHSNTYFLYERGGRGLCIDANPTIAQMFREQRPRDVFLNVGVSNQAGSLTYFMHGNPVFNSFSPEVSAHRARQAEERRGPQREGRRLMRSVDIPVITLDEAIRSTGFIDRFGTSVDVLSIDVEGLEREVIGGFSFETIRPKVLVVECLRQKGQPTDPNLLAPALDLAKRGYEVAGYTGHDLYLVDAS
ncbi:MAG: FkbM family methyltransferase [Frankiaceae bacterium]|nr:FkbM family methyltransferase [Frankiaceae bacterium]